ncbi:MAG: hypothetical protein L3J96_02180, partial [Thermoplasmata archaeon]|nr:hypothetical protein [Thermoplasmata archaeon]
ARSLPELPERPPDDPGGLPVKPSTSYKDLDGWPIGSPGKSGSPPARTILPLSARRCPACGWFPLRIYRARARPVAGVAAHEYGRCGRQSCRRSYHMVKIARAGAGTAVRLTRHLPFELADPTVEFLDIEPDGGAA